MAKHKKSSDQQKDLNEKLKLVIKAPVNDGMNTPVPDRSAIPVVSKSEAELFKQAENPLGDPDKI
ncbi:hypothetical protein AAKU52_002949 [Pedobacter sp. CG_S7]|uniref:hypothetical protein n=1 Tax=Pedobacter sp. CG_S7 TaxID=3143930 RepID=UPI0033967BDF